MAVMAGQNLTDILSELVAFKTVTGDALSAGECVQYLETYLGQRGLYLQRHDVNGLPALVASTKAVKKSRVMLQAHLDVVPCPGSLFTLIEKDGKLLGRGVYDMKFAAAVFLKLVDELQDELAGYDFSIMFTFDEELGGRNSNGVQSLLEAGYEADVCVLPDAGDNWHIEATHKGVWIVRLSTKGLAAHGSTPWDGDNAIHRLIDTLQEIEELFKNQHADTNTLSINQIAGGQAANQVAAAAEAVLDIRYINSDLYEQLRQKIEAIAARYKVSSDTLAFVKCVQTDMENPFVKKFLEIAEEVHGEPLEPIRSLGASDAIYFDQYNIPTILVRPNGGAAHSDAEWLDKASLEKYYQLIKKYVQKEAKVKQ